MISCKKTVELLSKAMDEPLSEAEKRSLAIHLHICEFCDQFRKHIDKIRRGMRGLLSAASPSKNLSGDAKAKILAKLKSKARGE